eukprot:1146332-Pelagomonas_calceolata.AAC.1
MKEKSTPARRPYALREGTRFKNQLEASRKSTVTSITVFQGPPSAQVSLRTILLGVGEVTCAPHALKPLKKLSLDTYSHQAYSEASWSFCQASSELMKQAYTELLHKKDKETLRKGGLLAYAFVRNFWPRLNSG